MWLLHRFLLLLPIILCHLCSWNFTDASNIYYYYRSYQQRSLARYYRAYSNINLGAFRYYQSRYSYYVRLFSYNVRTTYSLSRSCTNFEANTYGDYIGYFSCPLTFEWRNATKCCGSVDSHYCCDDKSKHPTGNDNSDIVINVWSWYIYMAIAIGCIVFAGGIFGMVYWCVVCCCIATGKTTEVRRNRVGVNVTGSYPVQTGSTQPPPYPGYPMQMQPPPAYPGPQANPPQSITVAVYPGAQANPAPPATVAAYPGPQANPAPPASDPAYPPPAAYSQN